MIYQLFNFKKSVRTMMTMQFYMHLTNITNILEAIRLTEDVYLYKKHNNGRNTCSW